MVPHDLRLSAENALALFGDYDLVADGSDNFATRYMVMDACHLAEKTLVSAAILRFDGQLSTYKPHARTAEDPEGHPCYRCIFGDQPEDTKGSCADVGVLGALAGVLGTLQAVEVVKELLDIGKTHSGRLLLYDALEASFHQVKVKADPGCPLCGPQATIKALDPEAYGPGSICAA